VSSAALPPRLARMSRIPHRLLAWGIPMGPLMLLRTRGRRTGVTRTVPVALLRHGDAQWLVSPFGDTAWVRNIRVDADAELGRGRRFLRVKLIEVDDDGKPEILHRYRRAFGVIPFVRHAFDAVPDDGPQAFHREAHRHPAFLIEPVD
jgi:deazaflavin-dependent oxidoreductase (nitroreductase family)